MSEIQDCVEDISTEYETIEMPSTWKMDQLKEWLLTWGLKRSGKKEVLVKRVYESCNMGMILLVIQHLSLILMTHHV